MTRTRRRSKQRSEGSKQTWERAEDVPMEDEDAFQATRDKILLGDDNEDSDYGEEDEVFALRGLPAFSSESDDDAKEKEQTGVSTNGVKKKLKSHKKKSKKPEPSPQSSSQSEEDEIDEGWGTKISTYYSSNQGRIDDDNEEDNELEEQEARRLQAEARARLDDYDFGLAEPDLEILRQENALVTLTLPTITESGPRARLNSLEKSFPEFVALARDWEDVMFQLSRAERRIVRTEDTEPSHPALALLHLYHQTLLSYVTNLAFFLHLSASSPYTSRPEALRKHPIMKRLLAFKQGLSTFEELDLAPSDTEGSDEMHGGEGSERDSLYSLGSASLEQDELMNLIKDAKSLEGLLQGSPAASKETLEPPKKKRKLKSSLPSTPVTFDLVEPQFVSGLKSSQASLNEVHDEFGDSSSLAWVDAADKATRKKALRFHTSNIESKNAKRQRARAAMGGDDDVPYKERRKEKETRVEKTAQNRVPAKGDDLDDEEPSMNVPELADDDLNYYDLVKKTHDTSKVAKKVEHDAERDARRISGDDESAEGPRSLTRAILANKGLTPRRAKSVRNPRVKKRMRFDSAKKKDASRRPIYKGGLASIGGRYEGEQTGISRVVKSVKL